MPFIQDRGSNGKGFFYSDGAHVSLGHVRLAITGHGEDGSQLYLSDD
jgi:asparagine synthetase B (glutamine-hydrolysing)